MEQITERDREYLESLRASGFSEDEIAKAEAAIVARNEMNAKRSGTERKASPRRRDSQGRYLPDSPYYVRRGY